MKVTDGRTDYTVAIARTALGASHIKNDQSRPNVIAEMALSHWPIFDVVYDHLCGPL